MPIKWKKLEKNITQIRIIISIAQNSVPVIAFIGLHSLNNNPKPVSVTTSEIMVDIISSRPLPVMAPPWVK